MIFETLVKGFWWKGSVPLEKKLNSKTWNLETEIWNPESGIGNPESEIQDIWYWETTTKIIHIISASNKEVEERMKKNEWPNDYWVLDKKQ